MITAWPRSEQAWHRATMSLAGGVSTGLRASMKPHPLYFASGRGSRLTDIDGNTYLDYVLGWGPVILGHGHPALSQAVEAAVRNGATFGSGHHGEYLAAEAVLATIPGTERVLWSNTGSEATQVALRLARASTGRNRFVKMAGHYHGWSDPFLVGYRPGPLGAATGHGTHGQRRGVLDDVTVVPFGDLAAAEVAVTAPGADIAAIFVEPVLCNSGVVAPPEGYLEGLRTLCDAHGVVLVFDEVITGFRIARGGAVEKYGVRPDLVVLAKAIAGGYPLAAVAGRAEVIDRVNSGVVHAGTYNGNPIVVAAGLATLTALGEDGVYQTFDQLGATLAAGMREALSHSGVTADVNQVGPVVQCSIGTTDGSTFEGFLAADQEFYDRLLVNLLRRGVFALPGGRWYLSTAHTAEEVAATVDTFGAALTATLTEGPPPRRDARTPGPNPGLDGPAAVAGAVATAGGR